MQSWNRPTHTETMSPPKQRPKSRPDLSLARSSLQQWVRRASFKEGGGDHGSLCKASLKSASHLWVLRDILATIRFGVLCNFSPGNRLPSIVQIAVIIDKGGFMVCEREDVSSRMLPVARDHSFQLTQATLLDFDEGTLILVP